MAEAGGTDMYEAQLQEVFLSCDSFGHGQLGYRDLLALGEKLHMRSSQVNSLTDQLLQGSPHAKVGFEEFKEGFIALLSQSSLDVSCFQSQGNLEDMEYIDSEETVSPKFQSGKKHYGRRSKPDQQDTEAAESPRSLKRRKHSHWRNESDSPSGVQHAEDHQGGMGDATAETFEAEGQLNKTMTEMENALDPASEEEHLRQIWQELGVGKDGFLTKEELAAVCKHIGMEEMNTEELNQLFERLDADQDGNVSFQEFLSGLFQHGGPPVTSSPIRPVTTPRGGTPRAKLRLTPAAELEERSANTSIIIVGSLFSVLDEDENGYAKAETIVELWESLGISNGVEILECLQFDVNTKVNLADLSFVLEQELRQTEEDNAIYQAALASYQTELRHAKSSLEQTIQERNKVQADLSEANSRISLLVKEGDERYISLEKTKEKDLMEVERKHQEQIKSLQGEIEEERDMLSSQASKQRSKLETEIGRLREEEGKLKEKLQQSQQELGKLEKELVELTMRCSQLEKQNQRLERELEAAADLHRQLEEMESRHNAYETEQQKFVQEKQTQLEADNKELKDKNDELTAEVQELTQQLQSKQRQKGKGSKGRERRQATRGGSVLSDYTKPEVVKDDGHSTPEEYSDENEDSPTTTTAEAQKRRLPQRPSESDSQSEDVLIAQQLVKLRGEIDELIQEKEQLEQSHQAKTDDLKSRFEVERKEIAEQYNVEIAELEEQFNKEREEMLDTFVKEKEELEQQHSEQLAKQLMQQAQELRAAHDEEKQDLLIKSESQKNLLEHKFAEEKSELAIRLKEEYQLDLESKLKEQREEILGQKATAAESESQSQEMIERLQQENISLEEKLQKVEDDKLKRDEMLKKETSELQLSAMTERQSMVERHEAEKAQLVKEWKEEQDKMLQGLLEDHETEKKRLAKEWEEEREKVKESLAKEHEAEKTKLVKEWKEEQDKLLQNLLEEHQIEREKLVKEWEDEKVKLTEALEKDHQAAIARELEDAKERLIQTLVADHEAEKVRLTKEWEDKTDMIAQNMAKEQQEQKSAWLSASEEEKKKLTQKLMEEYQEENAKLATTWAQEKNSIIEHHQEEKERLIKAWEEEKRKLADDYEEKVQRYENMLSEGEPALQGKVKEDFYALLNAHKADVTLREKTNLLDTWQHEKEDMLEKFELEKTNLCQKYSSEKEKIEAALKEQLEEVEQTRAKQQETMDSLSHQLTDAETAAEAAKLAAEQQMAVLEKKVSDLQQQIQDLQKRHTEELEGGKRNQENEMEEVQKQLKKVSEKAEKEQLELVQEKLRLQSLLEEERNQHKKEISGLERQHKSQQEASLAEIEKHLSFQIKADLEDNFVRQMERLKGVFDDERTQLQSQIALLQEELAEAQENHPTSSENQLKTQVEELNRQNSTLMQEKFQAERNKAELEQQLQQLLVEKQEVIMPSVASQAAALPPSGHSSVLEAIDNQSQLLEQKTRELKRQIQGIDTRQGTPIKLSHDKLVEEKKLLEAAVDKLHAQLQELQDRSTRADQLQNQLGSWETEKSLLEEQLDLANERNADISTAFSVANSEHLREVAALREQSAAMVEADRYHQLNNRFLESQSKLRELEVALEQRATETTRMLVACQEDHKRAVRTMELQTEGLQRQLKLTQELLDQQVLKLQEQLKRSTKTDFLVKDLYVENSELVKSLYETEKREKNAERALHQKEDECRALRSVLNKIVPAALA